MFGPHLALLHNVAMNAQFSLSLQWQQQSCTWPSLSLMVYQPPRCLEPSGSCCCWAPSTVRSSPPGPRNLPPAAGGRDAGNNREKKRREILCMKRSESKKKKETRSGKAVQKVKGKWFGAGERGRREGEIQQKTEEEKQEFKYQANTPRKSG